MIVTNYIRDHLRKGKRCLYQRTNYVYDILYRICISYLNQMIDIRRENYHNMYMSIIKCKFQSMCKFYYKI